MDAYSLIFHVATDWLSYSPTPLITRIYTP